MSEILAYIQGAASMAAWAAALFFLRFWRESRDRFFLFFAAAFFLEGLGRLAVIRSAEIHEDRPYIYLVRLAGYSLILVAIVDKNRARRTN